MNAVSTPVPAAALTRGAALAAAEQHIQKLMAELAQARLIDQLVEHLPSRLAEGLLVLDAAGTILLASWRLFRLLGLPDAPEAWQGRPARDLAAQVRPLLAAPLDLLNWLTPTAHQELLTLRGGAVLACEIMPAPPEAGPTATVLATLRDVTEQQRQLADLRAASNIADQNPSPIMRFAATGEARYVNPAAARLRQQLAPAERAQLGQQLRAAATEALALASPQQLQVAAIGRDFSVAVIPFADEGYANLYFSDITEREAVRRELNEQRQFMQQVFDNIPTIVFVRDVEQGLIFQNRAMQSLVAAAPLPPDPANIDPDSQLGRELAAYAAIDRRVLETGEEVSCEEPFTLADGEAHWFYTTKRRLYRTNGAVHVLGVTTDITPLKLAQRTLERSEKKYRDLMHYGQALIGTGNLQGTLLSVNPALATLLRENPADVPGTPLSQYLLPEDQPIFWEHQDQLAATGEDKGVLRVLPRGAQEVRYMLYHSVVVSEPNELPYVIIHGHDITERIQAEEEMKHAQLAAEAAVRARENFLANMSHEIRTPMNGVLGVANLLSKTTLTAEQQEYLGIINSSGHHLLAVLNDVLDMAKIASGKLELNLETIDLCDSMSQAVQPLALQAREKDLTFVGVPLRQSCPYPWVQADAARLNQILINLVSNAIKFTPAGGTVRVEGDLLTETADALTVRFTVTDTGIGMKAEVMARIFESFTQAYADTARRYGGTGLGLCICRALVEHMGGYLSVESTYGEGSTFAFVLTLAKATATAPAEPESFDTGALRGVRALLVEDNDINRFVARRTMEEWGVVVTEAVDGRQGVQLFEQGPYDVVLMDIQMPGMSGLEATTVLRAHPDPARARVPILALTANAFRADHEHYIATGMNDCLAKPFDEAQLYAKLLRLLRR